MDRLTSERKQLSSDNSQLRGEKAELGKKVGRMQIVQRENGKQRAALLRNFVTQFRAELNRHQAETKSAIGGLSAESSAIVASISERYTYAIDDLSRTQRERLEEQQKTHEQKIRELNAHANATTSAKNEKIKILEEEISTISARGEEDSRNFRHTVKQAGEKLAESERDRETLRENTERINGKIRELEAELIKTKEINKQLNADFQNMQREQT